MRFREVCPLHPPNPLGPVQQSVDEGGEEQRPPSCLQKTALHTSLQSRAHAARRFHQKASVPHRGSCSSTGSARRSRGRQNRALLGDPVHPAQSGTGEWTSQLPKQGEESLAAQRQQNQAAIVCSGACQSVTVLVVEYDNYSFTDGSNTAAVYPGFIQPIFKLQKENILYVFGLV